MEYVLVTGAGGGMGRETVRLLRDFGYTVFAMDKAPVDLQERIIPVTADITDPKSLQSAFEYVQTVTDTLYAIIHFAGIYVLDSLIEMAEQCFVDAFRVNVFGAFRVNKVFMPLLKEGSRIIITTSELAPLEPLPFTGLYAITKSALDKYAYSLRMELQLKGIAVMVLRPGAVQTGMLAVSTTALDQFCEKTQLYTCNATRFRTIVDNVEARNIPPAFVGRKVCKILNSRRIRFVYHLNRNPLLLMLNALPPRLQTWIIKKILM